MAIHTVRLPRVRQAAPVWQPTLRRAPLRQPRGVIRPAEPTRSRIARANETALHRANAFTADRERRVHALGGFILGLASAVALIGIAF